MDTSVLWFVLLATLAAVGFGVGRRAGRGSRQTAIYGIFGGLGLLVAWVWLMHHPAVAVNAIPISVLARIEGTGAVPIFMFVVGIAWARSQLPRQRRVVVLAVGLGAVYFLQGGIWLLQTTPVSSLAATTPNGVVMQSQDFSCVAAACATALNRLGIQTTEAEMGELTDTRPGTGATLIRALDGLDHRLAGTRFKTELVQPTYDELAVLPMPALTPLQFESTRKHMVVLIEVKSRGIVVADPVDGVIFMPRDDFEQAYTGQAIVFRR